jgi:hypothetical protein
MIERTQDRFGAAFRVIRRDQCWSEKLPFAHLPIVTLVPVSAVADVR